MTDAPSLKQTAFGDLAHELAATRRMLERVPEAHFSWKPHPKSMSLGALATHLANLPYLQLSTLQADSFDLATSPGYSVAPESQEALLRTFDERVEAVKDAFGAADDAAFGEPWQLRHGEHVLFTLPRGAAFRATGLSHMIHHRGQLSVYLRLLDVPVPGLYGPSADER